ncbi:MAG: hypothetical protein ACI9R3_002923 [Verrucomicrobiales bacterium]|jgi:hypothetical protein
MPTHPMTMFPKPVASAALVALLLIATIHSAPAADPLSKYKWKHRLIVMHLPEGESGAKAQKALKQAMRREKKGLSDRDLVVIDSSGAAPAVGGTVSQTANEAKAVRRQFGLKGLKPVFVLVGKDGSAKSRQVGTLDLGKFFALIDKMPMRRAEMKRKSSRK